MMDFLASHSGGVEILLFASFYSGKFDGGFLSEFTIVVFVYEKSLTVCMESHCVLFLGV